MMQSTSNRRFQKLQGDLEALGYLEVAQIFEIILIKI